LVKLGSAVYDTFAEKYQFWRETLLYFGDQEQNQKEILRYLPKSAEFVLDAGCGYGLHSLILADQVSYVVGVDISESMISLAKKRRDELGKINVDFVIGDLENLLFKKETFDFIVSHLTLFITNLDSASLELSQSLKPGGRMVINHIVTRNPRLDAIPIWMVLMAIKKAPKYALSFGFKTMWRLLSFEAGRAWIKYKCDNVRSGKVSTAQSLIKAYNRILPGCRFERHRWRIAVIWDAPIGRLSNTYD